MAREATGTDINNSKPPTQRGGSGEKRHQPIEKPGFLDPQSISEVPRGPLNNTRGTSLMDRGSKTAKESKHRGLFCI
ncbi:hypothetical protein MTR_2g050080 [Medicago truncatula]|uniref:Uncharacterized protein n=1 Tax=Medicago truncatula TaxID=3880 RepID=G7IQI1_MEDTR|nr:hypothetical protein MTR_2g050080 [Medicago truncatula]